MKKINSLDEAARYVMSLVEGDFKIAFPLGLGKANQLANIIYDTVKKQSERKLEIYSALSLDVPQPQSSLEKKLLQPFLDRHFGENYPRLKYVEDLSQSRVPDHISIHEFYFAAGQFLNTPSAQQNYISLNYTHAARGIYNRGLQILIQMISPLNLRTHKYSLSSNPDMTLDLADIYKSQNKKLYIIGVVHPDMPFLGGEAEVDASFFDAIVDTPEVHHQLFAVPRTPIDETDHMIGLHASQLIKDDGTLQIGIGSLSEALVYWIIKRNNDNLNYKNITQHFWSNHLLPEILHLENSVFEKGLYGTSEMIMDGFMHLRREKILKRQIFDHDESRKRYLHGAFFLGSKKLYHWLRQLTEEDFSGLSMTRVSKINDLYDANEMSLRRQRKNARFFNTCMQVDLLGAVASDTLETGQVVSGVGGQFNFVSMSQELPDSHSILMLRSTRTKKGKRVSNIIPCVGRTTIPRHLRDIIITEYGIAYLHGRSDAEVIKSLIEISDSEFQPELVKWAKNNKKIEDEYSIPEKARHNTPQKIKKFITVYKDFFPEDPFGSDFSDIELRLIRSLSHFKEKPKIKALWIILRHFFVSAKKCEKELEHMKLLKAGTLRDFFEQRIVIGALQNFDSENKN